QGTATRGLRSRRIAPWSGTRIRAVWQGLDAIRRMRATVRGAARGGCDARAAQRDQGARVHADYRRAVWLPEPRRHGRRGDQGGAAGGGTLAAVLPVHAGRGEVLPVVEPREEVAGAAAPGGGRAPGRL